MKRIAVEDWPGFLAVHVASDHTGYKEIDFENFQASASWLGYLCHRDLWSFMAKDVVDFESGEAYVVWCDLMRNGPEGFESIRIHEVSICWVEEARSRLYYHASLNLDLDEIKGIETAIAQLKKEYWDETKRP